MSARSTTSRPGPVADVADHARCRPGPVRGLRGPPRDSRSAMAAVVRCSSQLGSGWRCSVRRKATSSVGASRRSRSASRRSRRPLPGTSVRSSPHEQVDHRPQVAGLLRGGRRGALAAVGGAAPEDAVDPGQLVRRSRAASATGASSASRSSTDGPQRLHACRPRRRSARRRGRGGRPATCSGAAASPGGGAACSPGRSGSRSSRRGTGPARRPRTTSDMRREAVAHAQLDGAEVRVRADVPPHLADRC